MRVLVTGATSGLGRNAVECLLSSPYRAIHVRATGRNRRVGRWLEDLGAEFVPADLVRCGPAGWRRLVANMDVVWHCAALSAPWGSDMDFQAINGTATEGLAQAAIAQGAHHFVHISTPSIYFDYRHRRGVTESFQARRPANAYVRSKLRAEAALRRHAGAQRDTAFIILRPRALFGRYDRVLLPRVLGRLQKGRGVLRLPRSGATFMDVTYMPNVVHAMWLASHCAPQYSGRVFNITNQSPRRLVDVLVPLFAAAGLEPVSVRNIPYRLALLGAHTMKAWADLVNREPAFTPYSLGALNYDMTLDNRAAMEQLGYAPLYSMEQAIAATAAWIRNHGSPD